MNKKNLKKLIFVIIFISILVSFTLFIKNYNKKNYSESITFVKRIIKEKYDEVIYNEESDYFYAYYLEDNFYNYDIYDINGNNIYSFESNEKLDIVSIRKKYFIVKKDKFILYDNEFKEITYSDNIKALSNKLILVDNRIIDISRKVVFDNIDRVNNYGDNNYFLLNNNILINKSGEILLDGYNVVEEVDNDIHSAFLIVKKDKYYTFLSSFDDILGDGFDSYYIKDDVLYTFDSNNKYKIYKNGLRKKIITYNISKDITNNYQYDLSKIMYDKYLFVIEKKSNHFGLLNIDNNRFTKISNTINTYKKISDRYYLLQDGMKNKIYDIQNNKVVFESKYNLDNSLIYSDYYVIKNYDSYSLYDSKWNKIIDSDNQIILLDKKIKYGTINNIITIYDLETKKQFNASKFNINNKEYYKYNDGSNYYIVRSDGTVKYKSKNNIIYDEKNIIILNNKNITINNLVENKMNTYEVNNPKLLNTTIYRNSIIIKNSNSIEIINTFGENVKKIKNIDIKSIIRNHNNGKLIMIVTKDKDGKKLEGCYIGE
ncbi:MAG: hypothetical protein IKE73_02570 [Bacilli bacterium]|nr:hypothetical protein [Bacilli bacterium]